MSGIVFLALLAFVTSYYFIQKKIGNKWGLLLAGIITTGVLLFDLPKFYASISWVTKSIGHAFLGHGGKALALVAIAGAFLLIKLVVSLKWPTWQKGLFVAMVINVLTILMTVLSRGKIDGSQFWQILMVLNGTMLLLTVVFYWTSKLQQPLANMLAFGILVYLGWILGSIYLGWGFWWVYILKYGSITNE